MYGSNSGRVLDGQWVREMGLLGYCGGSTTSKLIGVISRGLDLSRCQQDNQVLCLATVRNLALLAQDASVISASKDGVSIPRAGPWMELAAKPRISPGFLAASTGLNGPSLVHLARLVPLRGSMVVPGSSCRCGEGGRREEQEEKQA